MRRIIRNKRKPCKKEKRLRHVQGSVDIPYSKISTYMRMISTYADKFVVVADNVKIYGHKNIFCPKYDACLDKACKTDTRWVCNGCEYEFTFEKLLPALPPTTIGDIDYYGYEKIIDIIG